MPDIFYLLSKWWKQVVLFVLLCCLSVAAILFLQPRQYLSQATALRANPAFTDKARLFNNNIEGLYSSLGSPDELDMIVGTAQLDTIYLSQVDSFSLVSHYQLKGDAVIARMKAAYKLHKHTDVIKSGYGELKVRVWDKDKNLAAALANAIMQKLQLIHQGLINENNISTLASLQNAQQQLLTVADSQVNLPTWKQAALNKQLEQYEELIGEYRLIQATRPLALLVVENARPATRADKPRIVAVMIATLLLSLVFALLTVLYLEKTRKP